MKVDKILLVDDDSITNDLNSYLINKLGVGEDIKVLKNGKEALTFLKDINNSNSNLPPLMFLDINMPVMNGLDFLKAYEDKLDELPTKPIIVVLSTTNLPDEIREIEESPSVMGHIEKPLTPEKLQRAIWAYVEYAATMPDEENVK